MQGSDEICLYPAIIFVFHPFQKARHQLVIFTSDAVLPRNLNLNLEIAVSRWSSLGSNYFSLISDLWPPRVTSAHPFRLKLFRTLSRFRATGRTHACKFSRCAVSGAVGSFIVLRRRNCKGFFLGETSRRAMIATRVSIGRVRFRVDGIQFKEVRSVTADIKSDWRERRGGDTEKVF